MPLLYRLDKNKKIAQCKKKIKKIKNAAELKKYIHINSFNN